MTPDRDFSTNPYFISTYTGKANRKIDYDNNGPFSVH